MSSGDTQAGALAPRVIALSGGIGGAKLVLGLSRVVTGDDLLVIANTGDDFEHCGLHISPDIDTLLYTLAGIADPERGWGLAGETWTFMEHLRREHPEDAWFQLGDKDLETHRLRTDALEKGQSLTEVTARLARHFGVRAAVAPMSDDRVSTFVLAVTEKGKEWLPFQEYFVKNRCEPVLRRVEYRGAENAAPQRLLHSLDTSRLEAVLIGPSNPFLSIDPILAIPGMVDRLRSFGVPLIAISPIVGGRAIKGPTAKIMRELGLAVDAVSIARHYQGVIDALVIDEGDGASSAEIEKLGVRYMVAPTVMTTLDDRVRLARLCLGEADQIRVSFKQAQSVCKLDSTGANSEDYPDNQSDSEAGRPEVLFLGRTLEPFASCLEPEVIVHCLWKAEDRNDFLKTVGPRIRAAATDAFTGADRETFEALPALEVLANFGVGYDSIDMTCARKCGVRVTNTPGVLDEDVADLAIGLMLSVFRRMPQGHRFVQDGGWQDGAFPLATRLSGKRLGIAGLGRIGKALARRAGGFGLQIAYHGRREQADQPYHYFANLVELAHSVDLLVALVPANKETDGLISREVLEALAGNGGIFINVARGSVVDEAALVDLLVEGRLGGAGLDVFANEPHVPEALLELDNVVLQPHVGSATHETRQAMGKLVIDNLLAYVRGQPLLTPVN